MCLNCLVLSKTDKSSQQFPTHHSPNRYIVVKKENVRKFSKKIINWFDKIFWIKICTIWLVFFVYFC